MIQIQYLLLATILLFSVNATALAQTQCQCTAKDAIEYVGEYCEVTGTVISTYQSQRSETVFLNMGSDFPNQDMRIVIFPNHLSNFKENPLTYYNGRTVMVKGKVILYKGDVQIIIDGEDAIGVLE